MEALLIALLMMIVIVAIAPFIVLGDSITLSQSITYPIISIIAFCFGVIPFIMFIGGMWQENEALKLEKECKLIRNGF